MGWAPGYWLDRARVFLTRDLWNLDPTRGIARQVLPLLQFTIMVGQGFVRDRLLLRASALTYFTVLSVVPLLAVCVSIVGAIGVGSEEFINFVVTTVAAGSPEAQSDIRQLIQGANFAALGTAGAAVLFVLTVLGISNVERAFNEIWGVGQGRSWGRRFPDYLSVLIIGPVLVGLSISLATTLHSDWVVERLLEVPGFATLYSYGLRKVPWIVLSMAFAYLYWFLPNTRVNLSSAILGGVPAALGMMIAQDIYLDFSVGVARADTFFGSFAALPMLFVWIYVFWAIALLGAEIAFAHQNLALYRREVRGRKAGAAAREAIGLHIALEVARRFRDADAVLDSGDLSDALGVPARSVRDVLGQLIAAGILSLRSDGGNEDGVQLGRPAERIQVTDVLRALRGEREAIGGDPAAHALLGSVLAELDEGVSKAAAGRTLADLLCALGPPASVDPPEARG